MLFNSVDFALFLPVVFVLYWFFFKGNLRTQNCLIVVASYFFYGWWDWRFLSLIIFSTSLDYLIGKLLFLEATHWKRKAILIMSLVINLTFLGFFKYYNFFIDSLSASFHFMGMEFSTWGLEIVLPVGISFYTFQSLSYTIDIYRGKIRPADDLIGFAAFISFFPQLVAGPIERASNLLPQFYKKRIFDYTNAVDGLRQMLWGFFKKMVIADNCAVFANQVFNNHDDYGGSTLLLGTFFFAFQIYCDFSGYSDIAIGCARLFGFSLRKNFAFPYFSRDIAEFWRRWHISLSSWFRDYVYIPLGGSTGTKLKTVKNVFIVFLLSGLWHGANWTFIMWGILNAIYFLPLLLLKRNRNNLDIPSAGRLLPNLQDAFSISGTFALVLLSWIFFRADNLSVAFDFYSKIFSVGLFSVPQASAFSVGVLHPYFVLVLLTFLVMVEWRHRDQEYALASLALSKPRVVRHAFYYAIVLLIVFAGNQEESFIYFQF